MDRVFNTYDDKYIAATKIYVKTGDQYAYLDSAYTVKAGAAELKEAFIKGMLLVADAGLYKPTGLSEASSIVTVTYLTANSSSAATLATVKSVK